MNGSEGLDALTNTFSSDRSFCDALATSPAAVPFAKLLIYARWAHKYFNAIQEELCQMVDTHFPASRDEAKFWTAALTGGVIKDVCLVPYLVARGLAMEAGYAVRRSLEHVGVFTHLWHSPEYAVYLDDPDSGNFRAAFINEPNSKKAAELKQKGIRKRFERCFLGKPASDLYHLFSAYGVHGGSPGQLMISEIKPTAFSCGLLNRADPKNLSREIGLLSNGCEILCVEVAFTHGKFGKLYGVTPSFGGEGGFFLTKLIDGPETPESFMSRLIKDSLRELRWSDNKAG